MYCAKLEKELKKTQTLVQKLIDKSMNGLQIILDMLENDKGCCPLCSMLNSFIKQHKQELLNSTKNSFQKV